MKQSSSPSFGRSPVVESLEERRMLSATVMPLVKRVVTVTGTRRADDIVISRKGDGNYNVSVNGVDKVYSGRTRRFVVACGRGDDTVTVTNDNGGVAAARVIDAGAGNDTVTGGKGADDVNGNVGDDHCDGRQGDDSLAGGADDDTLVGGVGDDSIRGDDGNDRVSGGDGNDDCDGSAGDDDVSGDDGEDHVRGGDGHDTFHGGHDDEDEREDDDDQEDEVEDEVGDDRGGNGGNDDGPGDEGRGLTESVLERTNHDVLGRFAR